MILVAEASSTAKKGAAIGLDADGSGELFTVESIWRGLSPCSVNHWSERLVAEHADLPGAAKIHKPNLLTAKECGIVCLSSPRSIVETEKTLKVNSSERSESRSLRH